MASGSGLKAVVFGGTGGVGKGIVKALSMSPAYSKVTLLLRKELELPAGGSGEDYGKFEQKLMDFEKIPEHKELFKGHDVAFYAIGVSQTQVTEAVYRKIELENALTIARMLREGEVPEVHWVTGRGTKKDSWFLFGKVKAEVEEKISQMGFRRAAFYRPGGVITPEREKNLGFKIFQGIDFSRKLTITSLDIGKAMVNNSLKKEGVKEVEIFENPAMVKLAAE